MKKVLVIDDEPDVGTTVKLILQKQGYDVTHTTDPVKGVGMVKKFDLLVLDIMMPVMSGRQVLSELKKQKVKTPVIVLSAVGLPAELERELAMKYPGTGFVPKTSMYEVLPAEIAKRIGAGK